MLKKPKILVVGSLNMDLIASATRVPNAGETVIGQKFHTAAGGKGLNQAVQCARLGADVTMVGKVGADAFGQSLLALAQESGVNTSNILIDPEESTGVAMIQLETKDYTTQNRITVCPGANYTITADEIAWLEKDIASYDIVILQFELPMHIVETVAAWAHAANVSVMVNPAPAAPVSSSLLACTSYFSPNEHEAALMANHPIRVEPEVNIDDVSAVTDIFLSRGVENLIITMGSNGSVSADRDGIHHVACVRMPEVVDPTAAGDSFIAAFCTALTAGLPRTQALAFASHAAAITVSRLGALPSLPDLQEVQELMQARKFTDIDYQLLDTLREA